MHSTYWINFYFTLLQLVLKDVKNQKSLQAEVNLENMPTVILIKKKSHTLKQSLQEVLQFQESILVCQICTW